jgi:SAM-dependent methyltransferase
VCEETAAINRHYGQVELGTKILAALQRAGKNIAALTRDDLAGFDEFHGGGRESTRELARLAGLHAGMHVLDIGSGVGGPARTLAAEFGCRVTGVDLTAEFCRAADMLTARVGLSDRVTFRQGSAVDLPFEADTFEVVWTQNVLMNVADKGRLFREAYRVLKPAGQLAFEALMAGVVTGVHLPVFWASNPALNFLSAPAEIRRLVAASGFTEVVWNDVTACALEMGRRRHASPTQATAPALGIEVIVEAEVAEKTANARRNFEEGRLVAVQAVFARS